MSMKKDAVVVGLGNPGPRYRFTRHNVGFLLMDIIAQEFSLSFSEKGLGQKTQCHWAEVQIGGKDLLLLKPQTFMNLSGRSVAKLYQHYPHLREVDLIICHDEADLAFGRVRMKKGGSDAGQNGLRSLREELGNGESLRIRMGIGKPPPGSALNLADYVLSTFQSEEQKTLECLLQKSFMGLETYLSKGLQAAQMVVGKNEGGA